MTNKTYAEFRIERETEALIGIAQDPTKTANIRLGATRKLWDIYGDYYLGLMAAKSRALNSDWSLQGLSDKERCMRISGQVFLLFWKVVQKFDLTLGVNFLAYLTNMGKWDLKTAKRSNSKMTERELHIDFSFESRPNKPTKDPELDEEGLMCAAINEISARNTYEKRVFHILAIEAAMKAVSGKQRLLDFLTVAFDVCRECPKGYSDTEVANRMRISKVHVGNYRRQVLELLERAGLITKYRGILAA
jgi:hypothetical protein